MLGVWDNDMARDDYLPDVARHMEWADATVWKSILAGDCSGDTALIDLLHHIHQVQHLFCQAWNSDPFKVRERAEFDRAEQLAAWGRGAHRQVQAFLAAVDSQHMDRALRLPWVKQFEQDFQLEARSHTVGESILHVALHTAHHRGQVCRHLRQLGGEPPLIDFIVWLWAGRPAADWTYLERRNSDA
jgi:uncharacterized damage-inducible protein DinB